MTPRGPQVDARPVPAVHVAAAPRIDSRLVAAVELVDKSDLPIAETSRRIGRLADRLGLVRPSYEQVRTLVHDSRRPIRRPTAGDVLLEVAFRVRPPSDLGDYLAGTLPVRAGA